MEPQYFKQKLETEKALLESELKGIAVKNKGNSANWDAISAEDGEIESRDDVADKMEEMNERKATELPLESQLQRVNDALARLETGNFGKCEICNREIEENRLQVNPSAKTCVEHREQEK